MKKFIVIILSIIFIFALSGCKDFKNSNASDSYFLFGITSFSKLAGGDVEKAKSEMKEFLMDFEDKVSLNKSHSQLSKINAAKAGEKVYVSKDVLEILSKSKELYISTNKTFNIAIYPVVDAWGFSPKNEGSYSKPRPQPSAEVLDALCIDLDLLEIYSDGYIIKRDDNLQLDLGAISKGYATDKCVEILERNNVTSGIINLGGNLYAYKQKPEQGDYKIGITHPRDTGILGHVMVNDVSVVTSGDYERYYIYEDKRYCHIMDSNTKSPTQSGVVSVTVINASSMICDAITTAVFVLGMEEGARLLNGIGLLGIIIDNDKNYYITNGINCEIYDKEYSEWQLNG